MRYMLDTNICIYLIRHHPPEVRAQFTTLQRGDVVMSAITLAELRFGVECHPQSRDQAELALNALVREVPVMPFDADAAVSYGVVRAAVRSRQREALDRLIAAHAVSLGCVLVTNNEADFKDYPGLAVENWVAASAH